MVNRKLGYFVFKIFRSFALTKRFVVVFLSSLLVSQPQFNRVRVRALN